MVLHRKQRKLAVPNTFDGTVIQIDMGNFQSGGAGDPVRLSNYREPMVLGGDKNPTAAKISDGMITSPVPVRQLGCGTTIGQANELVAETDSERGQSGVGQLANSLQCIADRRWIARSVGKKEAVRS
jgi:hypothetical protein